MKIKTNTWYTLPAGSEYWPCIGVYMHKDSCDYWKNKKPLRTLKEYNVKACLTEDGATSIQGMLEAIADHWGRSSPVMIITANLIKSDIVPIKREMTARLTKGSKWRLTEEYNYLGDIVPKGTEFTIVHHKGFIDFWAYNEKKMKVKSSFAMPTVKDQSVKHIPALALKFFGNIIECVTEGEERTYWKLLDKNDKPITDKKFESLNRVKSSVRYRIGYTDAEEKEIGGNIGNDAWLLEGAHGNTIDVFDEWKAIHYDSADKIIEEEELDNWFIMHILKRDY